MPEYASIRLKLVWTSATTFPTVMVTTARIAKTSAQSSCTGPRAVAMTRRIAANAAAFGATDMKAVDGVGAPSYASGVHWWNGTTAALKPSPAVTSASATTTSGLPSPAFATAAETWTRSVEPAIPNSQANPYTRIAELKAPRRKYFSAASLA